MSSSERSLSEEHIIEFQVTNYIDYRDLHPQEAFAKFDTKKSGLVSTKVLGDLLRQIGINPTKEELQVHDQRFSPPLFRTSPSRLTLMSLDS